MIVSEELFKLIHSLSQSEKRFFKIYASRHVIGEQNNYVLLFDEIVKQKSYDEEAIRIKFHGQAFMRRFPAVKNYLHQLIITSMRSYHSGSTVDIELKEMLIDLEFLYQKGLYKQCLKLHVKAEKLAAEADKKNRLLEILEWKAKLLQASNKGTESERFYEIIFKEESTILENIRLSLEIKSEVMEAFTLIRKKGFARSEKDLERIKRVIDKYSKLKYPKLSFNDKYYLNYINTVYYSSAGDHKKSLYFTERNVQLLESISPRLLEEEFEKHIVTLNNLVVNYIQLQRMNETIPYMNRIRSLATHNIRENILLWATSYKLVLGASIRSGNYEQAAKICDEVIEGMNFNFEKIPASDIVTFKYNIAVVYFVNKDYSRSARMLNEIINNNDLSLRDDILGFARIVRLLVFLEKGEEEMLPYATISVYRYLSGKKRLFKFENFVLQFIRERLPYLNSQAQQREAFKEMKDHLEIMFKDPYEKRVLEYFDFLTWIESKLKRKDMRTILKERIKT